MKRLLLIIILVFPLSCYDGLSDMLDDVTMKVPICVDASAAPGGDGRGWRNAFQTLQEAVAAAEDGDEIWVAGTNIINFNITINKLLSLYGGFKGTESRRQHRDVQNKTDIVGQTNVNITISSVNGVVIDGFKFGGFDKGVLLINSNSSVTVKSCFIVGNSVNGSGGAIDINDSELYLSDSVFEGNAATFFGGAINVNSSIVNISSSRFGDKDAVSTGNTAQAGGAIYSNSGSTLTISDNCKFYRNEATNQGGAVYVNNSALTIRGSLFGDELVENSGNEAGVGGAIFAGGSSTVNISDTTKFFRNKAELSDGSNGGAISVFDTSTLSINNCQFGGDGVSTGNFSRADGGAIYAHEGTEVFIENTIFKNNKFTYENKQAGGAISVSGAKLNVYGSLFSGNSGKTGGAVSVSDGAIATIENSRFYSNSVTGTGGAIYAGSSGTEITFINCTFTGNTASANGGAVYTVSIYDLNIDNCTFGSAGDSAGVNKNSTDGKGGALYIDAAIAGNSNTAVINNSKIYYNTSGSGTDQTGGGIYAEYVKLTINASEITGNSTTGSGGGIYFGNVSGNGQSLTITDSTISSNTAGTGGTGNGGGVFVNKGETTISACRFIGDDNESAVRGGAVHFAQSEESTIVNSYFYNNRSSSLGGAISAGGNADHAFVNLTFHYNRSQRGGAIYFFLANMKVFNSVFYKNYSATLGSENIISDSSEYYYLYNCYFDDGMEVGLSGESLPGGYINAGCKEYEDDPFASTVFGSSNFLYPSTGLGVNGLINNGMSDFADTEIVDHFTMPATDLAGNPRNVGGIDIGAYERQ